MKPIGEHVGVGTFRSRWMRWRHTAVADSPQQAFPVLGM